VTLRIPLLLAMLIHTIGSAVAGNVDPDMDSSRFGWSENAGWIDFAPAGPGGPGLQVDDFELSGWAWSENAGWISFSCRDTASCAAVDYRSFNDGMGHLSGRAWSENAGWIDLAPLLAGVLVDPSTGVVSGRAWSENLGWITFRGTAQDGETYGVTVGWLCDPAPSPPTGVPQLTMSELPDTVTLEWTAVPDASGYDVIRGDLQTLREGGAFWDSVESCLADNQVDRLSADDIDSGSSAWTFWLVRAVNCGSAGSWNSGGSGQSGDRNPQINPEPLSCP
jgi:hypothetical protein